MMVSRPCSVLIVDDEPSLRKVLRMSLSAGGYSVEEAPSGEEALGAAQNHPIDLVLLDVNMPGIGGVETCRRLRDLSPRTGIVMLTVRDMEDDKVIGLEAGADDYLTKPFHLRELIVRLSAVLRRTRGIESRKLAVLQAGALTIDLPRRILWRSGLPVHLSPKEFDLLAFMMQNQGAPLTHVRLLRSIWGPEYGNELEYLRSYVRMLRKKIEEDPSHPEFIITEPWVGYRFCNPDDRDAPGSDSPGSSWYTEASESLAPPR
jgi:two-component system, OmpR family, KDP operon response regulator KdpE